MEIIHKNLQDAVIAVLKGKFIAINAYFQKIQLKMALNVKELEKRIN